MIKIQLIIQLKLSNFSSIFSVPMPKRSFAQGFFRSQSSQHGTQFECLERPVRHRALHAPWNKSHSYGKDLLKTEVSESAACVTKNPHTAFTLGYTRQLFLCWGNRATGIMNPINCKGTNENTVWITWLTRKAITITTFSCFRWHYRFLRSH